MREAMSFGNGGRPWSFYVPVPRVFQRRPAPVAPPPSPSPSWPEDVAKVMAAAPLPGTLPVADVGRWTVRARYALADGMFAVAPEGRRLATDFAIFESHYAVHDREVVLERTVVVKRLAIDPGRESELQAFYEAVEADRRQEFRMTSTPPGGETTADCLNLEAAAAIDRRDFAGAVETLQHAIDADPRHVPTWYNLSVAHLADGDVPAAIAAGERTLEIDRDHLRVRIVLGQAYFRAGRSAEGASGAGESIFGSTEPSLRLGELRSRRRPSEGQLRLRDDLRPKGRAITVRRGSRRTPNTTCRSCCTAGASAAAGAAWDRAWGGAGSPRRAESG